MFWQMLLLSLTNVIEMRGRTKFLISVLILIIDVKNIDLQKNT